MINQTQQTKQSKQSKQAYSAQISGPVLRKQSQMGSASKLVNQQTSKKADSNSKTRQSDDPPSKFKPDSLQSNLQTGFKKSLLSSSAQKSRKNSSYQVSAIQVNESAIFKAKQSKTPYQDLVPKKQSSGLQMTPSSSTKKADSTLPRQSSLLSRTGSQSIISDQKQTRQPQSGKAEKRESTLEPGRIVQTNMVPSRSIRKIQTYDLVELSRSSDGQEDRDIYVDLYDIQTTQPAIQEHSEGLPNFRRYNNFSENKSITSPKLLLLEEEKIDVDTTNEDVFLEKQNQIPTEISPTLLFATNSGTHSCYAVRKPYPNGIIPRSPNSKSFVQTQVKKMQEASERTSEDMEVTDLSASENNSAENELKSKISNSSQKMQPQIGSVWSEDYGKGSEWHQEINYNQEQESIMKDQSNASPKYHLGKRHTNNGPSYKTQQQPLQVQYINNLQGTQEQVGQQTKIKDSTNTSHATTLLASANTSIFSIGAMHPQQMTHIPKSIQSRQPMNITDVNISMQKIQSGQSPTLRQETQHSLVQNNNTQGRRTLAMSNKVSGNNLTNQTIALANRVQVSPINKNTALSREIQETNTPLVASHSSQSLQKKSTNQQFKLSHSLLAPNKSIQSTEGTFSNLVHQTNTQKQQQRKNGAVLTPGSIPYVPKTEKNSNEKPEIKHDFPALIRMIEMSRLRIELEHQAYVFSPAQGDPRLKETISDEILNVALDEPNQNVIQADSQRTRFLTPAAKQQMVCLLTYYVKHEKITYKQGINEILLPFLWFESRRSKQEEAALKSARIKSLKQPEAMLPQNLQKVFFQLKVFIDRYLPNIFVNDEFVALQSCMTLIRLLFRYHAPKLYCYLEEHQITIEMYAIPWIITYFSTKFDTPELVLELWNKVAEQPSGIDVAYIFFFAVALIMDGEQTILDAEYASLPVVMASLRVREQRDLTRLFERARKLIDNTPFSFVQLPELQMIMSKTAHENLVKIWKSLELLTTLPLLPAELFFYCFPEECDCSNPTCANSLTYKKSATGNYLPPLSTSICPDLVSIAPNEMAAYKQTVIETRHSGFKSSEQRLLALSRQDPLSKEFHLGTTERGSPTRNSQLRFFGDGRLSKLQNQMETESNLNCDMDHQESPIDLINETTRMKHLNADDCKENVDQLLIQLIHENLETPEDYEENSIKSKSSDKIRIDLKDVDRLTTPQAEICKMCKQRSTTQRKLDSKTNKLDESFEDLSPDCLINQIRFIAIDCRLNSLRQEGALPHSLSFDLSGTTKLEQLKHQVEQLSMYKETHHICLIGLSAPQSDPNDVHATPKRKLTLRRRTSKQTRRLNLKDFHEDVLQILSEQFVQQGFQHISTLPGGFQQVHQLACKYGFNLLDHDCKQMESLQVVSPSGVERTLQKRCYHCKQSTLVEQSPLVSIRHIISIKQEATSPEHFATIPQEKVDPAETTEDVSYYFGNLDSSLLLTANSMSDDDDKFEQKKGGGFDLSGGWEYIPFGLRQVYEAASHINRILSERARPDQARPSEPTAIKPHPIGLNAHKQDSAGSKPLLAHQSPQKQDSMKTQKIFMIAAQDQKPIQFIQRSIRLSDDVHERDSGSKYVFQNRDLSYKRTNTEQSKLNALQQFSTDTGCKDRLLNDFKNPQYQNLQHLQQQSQYKLISKVTDTQNQDTNSKDEGGHLLGNQTSPLRRNRPRINNEIQPQDVNHYLRMIQQEKNAQQTASTGLNSSQRKLSEETEKGQTNLNISNVYNLIPIERQNLATNTRSQAPSSTTEYIKSSQPLSVYASSTLPRTDTNNIEQISEGMDPKLLQVLEPREESYLLNGLVKQVPISRETYESLTSTRVDSHVSYVFTAVRLPARKKNLSFHIVGQTCFNFCVPSKILITPYTVAILHREHDLDSMALRQQTEEMDSTDFEETDSKVKSTINSEVASSISQTNQRDKSFAVLQSRFFMYDLIKITSRKSTTKIITFYFRIPKLTAYPVAELEKSDILQRLNSKPTTKYAFAFKRTEFEEVSMSFEFELEEQAKICIANVSNLYKKLKNTQKRSSKKVEKSITEESEVFKQLQIKPVEQPEAKKTQPEPVSQRNPPEKQAPKSTQISINRNAQNPGLILSRMSGQSGAGYVKSYNQATVNQLTPSQNSQQQKP